MRFIAGANIIEIAAADMFMYEIRVVKVGKMGNVGVNFILRCQKLVAVSWNMNERRHRAADVYIFVYFQLVLHVPPLLIIFRGMQTNRAKETNARDENCSQILHPVEVGNKVTEEPELPPSVILFWEEQHFIFFKTKCARRTQVKSYTLFSSMVTLIKTNDINYSLYTRM